MLARVRGQSLAGALAPESTPEDIVQEFVVRLIGSGALDRIDDQGDAALWSFLDAVLSSTIVDLLRARRAAKRGGGAARASLDDTEWRAGARREVLHARDTSPTTGAARDELRERALSDTVRVLNPREWHVWHAIDIEARSSERVAAELGVSASRLRALLSQARQKVLPVLGRRFGGAE